jgi:hypothetical protein
MGAPGAEQRCAVTLAKPLAEKSQRAREFSTDRPMFLHSSQQASGNMMPRIEALSLSGDERSER